MVISFFAAFDSRPSERVALLVRGGRRKETGGWEGVSLVMIMSYELWIMNYELRKTIALLK